MKVLVTGSSGFIGKAITKRLDWQGISWTPFVGDVLRREDFQSYKDCSTILHLAGMNRTGLSYIDQKACWM